MVKIRRKRICLPYDQLPLVLRVEDLMPVLDIGRNTAYELVRSGQIVSIRVGRQLRISRDALVKFINEPD